jgi:NADH-quinone oxidoreductase subunit L
VSFFLQYAWLIPLFPLLAFVIISLTPLRRNNRASGWLAIGMMALAMVFALGLLAGVAAGLRLDESGQVVAGAASAEAAHGAEAVADEEGAAAEEHGFAFASPNVVQRIDWVPTGESTFRTGIYIDPLAAVMLAMVTITSFCIHLFSMGYMAAHPRQARFFSFVALFTAAMLLMTMAGDLLLFFMAWEVMGLCSYLLIGFLFERPTAMRAGVKAFITTRIGDVLMLIGMAYYYMQAGTLEFGVGANQLFNPELLERLGSATNLFDMSHATAIALLIFAGTVGKAAQFPLHVWLPDAMEGPTPVSALIHAATMVSAGVYLVGRVYPIFTAGAALGVVAFIGAFTALFAATIAVAQFDIKRILAYSTLSQLGFMVAALGIGGWVAGMFHLLTHAFFKALLFLGSGSIIHSIEETRAIEEIHHQDEYAAQQSAQDIRNMGGLRELMPWTFWTYTMGYLALAGIPIWAGFWSKDEILADAAKYGHWVVYAVLTLASFLTAFYMTRQWRAVFFGSYRGEDPLMWQPHERPDTVTAEAAPIEEPHAKDIPAHAHDERPPDAHDAHDTHGHHASERPREHDWTMVAPLVVLATFATLGGFFNLPFSIPGAHWLSDLWQQEAATFNPLVAIVAVIIAAAGIGAGWFYGSAFPTARDPDPLEQRSSGLFGVLNRAYGVDRFYRDGIVQLTDYLAISWNWFDRMIIDRIVVGVGNLTGFLGRLNFIIDDTFFNDGPDGLANSTHATGDGLRHTQTGKAQDYLGLIFGGIVVLALIYLYLVLGA